MLGEAPVSSPSLRKDADAEADAEADAVGRFHSPRFTSEGKKGRLSQRGPEPGSKSRPVASAKPRHIRAGLLRDLVRSGEAVTPLPPKKPSPRWPLNLCSPSSFCRVGSSLSTVSGDTLGSPDVASLDLEHCRAAQPGLCWSYPSLPCVKEERPQVEPPLDQPALTQNLLPTHRAPSSFQQGTQGQRAFRCHSLMLTTCPPNSPLNPSGV